jgi:hypothetical protein
MCSGEAQKLYRLSLMASGARLEPYRGLATDVASLDPPLKMGRTPARRWQEGRLGRDHDALGRGMKAISARIARAVNRVFSRRGAVVADRYHLHVLRTPREVWNALRYVLLNGHKHARRSDPGQPLDPASSSRWFTGWRDLDIRATSPPTTESSPVMTPRTWLLAVGWRKHGLLDPREVPGRCSRRSTTARERPDS